MKLGVWNIARFAAGLAPRCEQPAPRKRGGEPSCCERRGYLCDLCDLPGRGTAPAVARCVEIAL